MKKLVIIIICMFPLLRLSSQIISSGIASIMIENNDIGAAPMKTREAEEIPEIELINPNIKDRMLLNWDEAQIDFIGKVNSYGHKCVLYLNSRELEINDAGFFNSEYKLVRGLNDISIRAVTDNSMISELSFQVDFQPGLIGSAPGESGKYYALIIGINDYTDPLIAELDRPIHDAESFYDVITSRYSFEKENIRFLRNATNAEIINALDSLSATILPNDNLLIFYAGHGTWDSSTEIGYWLPSDARKNSKLAWFRNSTLRDYLREIKSKHTLLISDACFGGSILKTRGGPVEVPKAISHLYSLPSRKAMTSGTLTDVPDQSMFLKYLIERLNSNNEKYLSSEQLFSSFRIAVINNSNVVPQFGEIRDVGDQGGDFIFVLK
jgi:hypothetical protein